LDRSSKLHAIDTGIQDTGEIQISFRDHYPHTETLALINLFSMGGNQKKNA
jgi:hypothetical protein